MKLRTFKTIENAVWRVAMQTEAWGEGDVKLMEKFGEPEIDLGGSFTDGSDLEFTLDSRLVKIKTESPFVGSFDSRDLPDEAEARANLWAMTIASRIVAALATLRASADTFTDENVETL